MLHGMASTVRSYSLSELILGSGNHAIKFSPSYSLNDKIEVSPLKRQRAAKAANRQQLFNLPNTERNSLKTATKQHRRPCYLKSPVRMFALEIRRHFDRRTWDHRSPGLLASELSCLRSANFGC